MQNSAMAAAKENGSASAAAPTMPQRRVQRNKSGPLGARTPGRRPPGRSKSHKIGRPAFSKELPPEPTRGVNRNKSGRLRSTPNRTRSFGRSAPDRSGSSGSQKRQQNSGEGGDDVSVSDSVFTSASNQTLDSIMLRKKQFGPGDAKPGGMRMPTRSVDAVSFEIDDSLHTVDSINVHHRHVQEHGDDDQGDFSVFSESFASTDTYELSDYDEEEGGDLKEVEFEEEEEEEEEIPLAGGDEDEPMQE